MVKRVRGVDLPRHGTRNSSNGITNTNEKPASYQEAKHGQPCPDVKKVAGRVTHLSIFALQVPLSSRTSCTRRAGEFQHEGGSPIRGPLMITPTSKQGRTVRRLRGPGNYLYLSFRRCYAHGPREASAAPSRTLRTLEQCNALTHTIPGLLLCMNGVLGSQRGARGFLSSPFPSPSDVAAVGRKLVPWC